MRRQVLYIGASGFVGTRLIDATKNDFIVSNLDKQKSSFFPELTTVGDVRSKGDIEGALQNKQIVVLLAAEHRDDVHPISLYYDVNVQGTRNVVEAMTKHGVKNIIFTSSVAVYGLDKNNPDELHKTAPFNHYGESKLEAEDVLREWYAKDIMNRSLIIIRPTVIFGERNRGNVYNLLRQIASGRFVRLGKGTNFKSMAYVENVAAFIRYQLQNLQPGYKLYNYVDKPDMNMNELVAHIEKILNKQIPSVRFPYWVGLLAGVGFDVLSRLTGKKFAISLVRAKKFCATTQFDASVAHSSGFKAPFSLSEGLRRTLHYEFINPARDDLVFLSE